MEFKFCIILLSFFDMYASRPYMLILVSGDFGEIWILIIVVNR